MLYGWIFIVDDQRLGRRNLFRTPVPSLFRSADIPLDFNDKLRVYFQFNDKAADPHFNYTFTFFRPSHTKQLVLPDKFPSVFVNFSLCNLSSLAT
jgi:hypothetical protein